MYLKVSGIMEQTLNRVENLLLSFYQDNPFVQYLGIKVESVEFGKVQLSMQIKHEYTNVYKIAHGGALMSVADTAMGAACLSVNKKVVTLDFNMNLMKAVPENQLIYAVGRILHNGARTIVAECEIIDEAGNLYGKARGTFFVNEKFVESIE